MLYTEKNKHRLDAETFKNPPQSYKGAPFWAWNTKLSKELLQHQIDVFKKMGFGGFFMHTRVGLEEEYLGTEFMEYIRFCVEYAKEQNMYAWLYDEDRYPSGSAGGFVTRNKEYRARSLKLTKEKYEYVEKEEAISKGLAYLVACYDIKLDFYGKLVEYKIIDAEDDAENEKYYAISVASEESGWFNNQTYADLLNPDAVDAFLRITHESYKKAVGTEFTKAIPGIFTDEPQLMPKRMSKSEISTPWTKDIEERFYNKYEINIADVLPQMFFDGKNRQYCYILHRFLNELFYETFSKKVGEWCKENELMFTGHMMAEQTMGSQTQMIGEAMSHYKYFGVPGIDMLMERYEYLTLKQAQSVVHQSGSEGLMSELYGVTDWDYDFRGYKEQGDWQAAMGVTLRVPHLAHAGMKGEAKRDFPASINYQSPWHKEFGYIENHFARLNLALTRGKPIVRIGIIHPIESYWHEMVCGNELRREYMDEKLENLVKWLLFENLDFDFISENLICEQNTAVHKEGLTVDEMEYSVILVPDCIELRKTTRDILEKFHSAGGSVIFAGNPPQYEDGSYNPLDVSCISFDKISIVEALEPWREINISYSDGSKNERMIYNYRSDNDCKWLFVCYGAKVDNSKTIRPKPTYEEMVIRVKGCYKPYEYNTLTGEISEAEYTISDGFTYIQKGFYSHDSLLLKLVETTENEYVIPKNNRVLINEFPLTGTFSYKIDEENALLLDRGKFALNSEEYSEAEEELLRADNICKRRMSYPESGMKQPQPWVSDNAEPCDTIKVKFGVFSECDVENAILALEEANRSIVKLNDETVISQPEGYYVDKTIGKVRIGKINKGYNKIEVLSPFGRRTNLEWMYLLGDFGVKVCGSEKIITQKPQKLGFSTVTNQGLPFYTGNISYIAEIETEDGELEITVPKYRGALVRVYLDGVDCGIIAFEPYTQSLGNISAGKHTIELKLYGNRYNGFGSLHNTDDTNHWAGPDRWRTTLNKWGYGYSLRDMGILSEPVIKIYKNSEG